MTEDMSALPDLALLEECMSGNQAAWAVLVGRHQPGLRQAIHQRLRREGVPAQLDEDIAQIVWERLSGNGLRLLRSYDPSQASFATWLGHLGDWAALKVAHQYRRRKSWEKPLAEGMEPPTSAESLTPELAWDDFKGALKPSWREFAERAVPNASAAELAPLSPECINKRLQRLEKAFTVYLVEAVVAAPFAPTTTVTWLPSLNCLVTITHDTGGRTTMTLDSLAPPSEAKGLASEPAFIEMPAALSDPTTTFTYDGSPSR